MIEQLKHVPRPVLIGVGALIGLVAIAATIGGSRAPEAMPAAPEATPAPASVPSPAAPAAPVPAPAVAPVATVAGLPPAVALDAPQQPASGALETVELVGADGALTALGSRTIDGQALGLVDMTATRSATGGAGWGRAEIRVTRAGLVRVPENGAVSLILSNQSEPGFGGSRSGTACRLAVGDPGNVLLAGDGDEQATSAELLAGWHRVYVMASRTGTREARCRLAVKLPGVAAPAVAELFDLAKPAAPAEAAQ